MASPSVCERVSLPSKLAQRSVPRDVLGENLHLWVAVGAILGEAISTPTASIGFIALLIVGAIRGPVLLPVWRSLLLQRWVQVLLLWVAWSAVSLSWSPNIPLGVDRLFTLKYLLWIPLLYPLHARWRELVAAIVVGALIALCLKVLGLYLGGKGGLGRLARMRHPTSFGLWEGFALCVATSMAFRGGALAMIVGIVGSGIGLFGLILASQRGPLTAWIVSELLLVPTAALIRLRVWPSISRVVAVAAVLTAAGFASGLAWPVIAKFRHTYEETVQTAALADGAPIPEVRLALWKLALVAWSERPLVGVGIGGYQSATAKVTSVQFNRMDIQLYDTPHSTPILALTEGGVVGLSLLLAGVGMVFLRACRNARVDPSRLAVVQCLMLWCIAACFDSFQTRGVFLVIGLIIIALATMPTRAIVTKRATYPT